MDLILIINKTPCDELRVIYGLICLSDRLIITMYYYLMCDGHIPCVTAIFHNMCDRGTGNTHMNRRNDGDCCQ